MKSTYKFWSKGACTMNRRDFLRSAGAASVSLELPKTEWLLAEDRSLDKWRTFEVKTPSKS